eukprot:TRINITY_DN113628_c0_g1_i1.p1 TRINITY_DN113628_c0_g1~~TRINITY_DN113628_c0_g1_i1.p1  ORF type:complete len:261 (+),score=34.49 TRINITY_DN113628_c0_g1_i1:41-784(+)
MATSVLAPLDDVEVSKPSPDAMAAEIAELEGALGGAADEADATEDAADNTQDQQDEQAQGDEEQEDEDLARMQAELAGLEKKIQDIHKEEGTPDQSASGYDALSIHVSNVDYSVDPKALSSFFEGCGAIARATVIRNKLTGKPMGYAYVEFKESESVKQAVKKDGELLSGRQIKVTPKRVNIPGMTTRGGRGGLRGGVGGAGGPVRRPRRAFGGGYPAPYPPTGFRPRRGRGGFRAYRPAYYVPAYY